MITVRQFLPLFLLILLFLFMSAQPVEADEYLVGCGVNELISAVNSANSSPTDDTITLATGCTYTLTTIDNNVGDGGGNGLPAIVNNGALTINGNNAIIERSNADNTPEFRLLYISSGANLTLNNLTLRNGKITVDSGAGGGFWNQGGTVNVINSMISGNDARAYGSGFANENGGVVNVTNSTIVNNLTVGYGSGFANYNGSTVNVTNSLIANNGDGGDGGGFWNNIGTTTITNSTLSGNRAIMSGGAFSSFEGSITISGSTLANNSSSTWGGGFYNFQDSAIIIRNSTLTGNTATTDSGAFKNGGTLTIINTTIYNNSASAGGGFVNFSDMTLHNSITANNSNGDCILGDGILDGSYNLFTSPCTPDSYLPGESQLTHTIIANPMLGAIMGNPAYFPLMAFSPAIDAGSNTNASGLTSDQTGNSRFYDDVNMPDTGEGTAPIVDIGAVERQMNSPARPTVSINNVTLTEGTGGSKEFAFTLRLAPAYAAPVTVQVRTSDGTASASSDYTAIPLTTFTFAPGEDTKQLVVVVNSDSDYEADETFTVELGNPTNAILGSLRGTGTILNDDEQPPIELPDMIAVAPEVPDAPATPLPVLINPLGYTSQNPVILLWIGPPTALQYRVLVQKQADRSVFVEETLSAQLCNGNMCELMLPFIPAENTPYVWLVQAITADGLQAPSMEGNFIYIPFPLDEMTLPGEIVLPDGE